jgi:hypothetical protein
LLAILILAGLVFRDAVVERTKTQLTLVKAYIAQQGLLAFEHPEGTLSIDGPVIGVVYSYPPSEPPKYRNAFIQLDRPADTSAFEAAFSKTRPFSLGSATFAHGVTSDDGDTRLILCIVSPFAGAINITCAIYEPGTPLTAPKQLALCRVTLAPFGTIETQVKLSAGATDPDDPAAIYFDYETEHQVGRLVFRLEDDDRLTVKGQNLAISSVDWGANAFLPSGDYQIGSVDLRLDHALQGLRPFEGDPKELHFAPPRRRTVASRDLAAWNLEEHLGEAASDIYDIIGSRTGAFAVARPSRVYDRSFLLRVTNGEVSESLPLPDDFRVLSMDPQAKVEGSWPDVVLADGADRAFLHDGETGELVPLESVKLPANSVMLLEDADVQLVTRYLRVHDRIDEEVRLYDVSSDALLHTLPSHEGTLMTNGHYIFKIRQADSPEWQGQRVLDLKNGTNTRFPELRSLRQSGDSMAVVGRSGFRTSSFVYRSLEEPRLTAIFGMFEIAPAATGDRVYLRDPRTEKILVLHLDATDRP